MKLAYLSHPSSLLHDMGDGHPECPQRIEAIERRLAQGDVLGRFEKIIAPAATQAQMLRAHSEAHILHLQASAPDQGICYLDPDTAMNRHSFDAARHAAGAVVHAVDLVVDQGVDRAFCGVRPPGHHATYERAMGFCLVNSIAVGVQHALTKPGIERVAIVDFDVHHGNGTEDIFFDEPRVLMVSTFQSPLYPYSGETPMGPNMANVPLPPNSSGEAMKRAVTQVWLPRLREFQPDLLFISAGFDAHEADGLASLAWRDEDYAWLSQQLVEFANEFCNGRIVSSLEGGYNLAALSRCVELHLKALAA